MAVEPMGQRDLLVMIATALNTHHVPYLLSGSFASSYYGHPRATHDIDFVVEVSKERLELLVKAIRGLGKGFVITAKELERVSMPQLVSSYHAATAIKIDFWITDGVDFSIKYARRRRMTINRTRISLIAPEDLMLTKLVWCKEVRSERHVQDCIGIWRVQKGKLDEGYLYQRAEELDVTGLLLEVTVATLRET